VNFLEYSERFTLRVAFFKGIFTNAVMTMKYILGNWKMNGTRAEARELARAVATCPVPGQTQVVLFPPSTLLSLVHRTLEDAPIALGAQDVSPEIDGAFTGEISAAMLKEVSCSYVLAGHSERRAGHGETDELVGRKAAAALKAGLIPVICVGESLTQRESGQYLGVIRSQVEKSLPKGTQGGFIIAYEPVWAIGSGKTPTLAEIVEVHKTIASALSYATSGAHLGIVYGGSVKAANAREILSGDGVDGVLVGGASLKANEFSAIIAAAH
jgi:triosephosphate isomerase